MTTGNTVSEDWLSTLSALGREATWHRGKVALAMRLGQWVVLFPVVA
jgi:hypothetical protein